MSRTVSFVRFPVFVSFVAPVLSMRVPMVPWSVSESLSTDVGLPFLASTPSAQQQPARSVSSRASQGAGLLGWKSECSEEGYVPVCVNDEEAVDDAQLNVVTAGRNATFLGPRVDAESSDTVDVSSVAVSSGSQSTDEVCIICLCSLAEPGPQAGAHDRHDTDDASGTHSRAPPTCMEPDVGYCPAASNVSHLEEEASGMPDAAQNDAPPRCQILVHKSCLRMWLSQGPAFRRCPCCNLPPSQNAPAQLHMMGEGEASSYHSQDDVGGEQQRERQRDGANNETRRRTIRETVERHLRERSADATEELWRLDKACCVLSMACCAFWPPCPMQLSCAPLAHALHASGLPASAKAGVLAAWNCGAGAAWYHAWRSWIRPELCNNTGP